MPYKPFFLGFLLVMGAPIWGREENNQLRVYLGQPSAHNESLNCTLYYSGNNAFRGSAKFYCYLYRSRLDSIRVFNGEMRHIKFSVGTGKVKLHLCSKDSTTYLSQPWLDLLKKTGMPPGHYRTYIRLIPTGLDSSFVYVQQAEIDSNLPATSPIRQDLNKDLVPAGFGIHGNFSTSTLQHTTCADALAKASKRMGNTVKMRGLRKVQTTSGTTTNVDLFLEDWFAGRYTIDNNRPLSSQLADEQKRARRGIELHNDLDFHPSLFSQFQSIGKQKTIIGEISYAQSVATGQEQYSLVNNNFYELRGNITIPLGSLPVQLEGLYTSQDRSRNIKASYIRVHYDVQAVKNELMQQVSTYNQKFAETQSKMTGLNAVYMAAISRLQRKRDQIAEGLPKSKVTETQVEVNTPLPDTDTKGKLPIDSVSGTSFSKVSNVEREMLDKQEQIKVLEEQIQKYQAMLSQYDNVNYFDSAMSYSKTNKITNYENLSYRQLVTKSQDILPDGATKKLVTGITSFDIGMYSKYTSKYTMAGQQVKGVDFGYDFGPCEIAASAGKTEYLGRDGGLDKYTFYSARVSSASFHSQKLGMVYYGYTADKTMLANDPFFKQMSLSRPQFAQPVHIISGTYEGTIAKAINFEGEVATSRKQTVQAEGQLTQSRRDNIAYHLSVEGNIPHTTISINGNYDRAGRDFENQTLPLVRRGTEQYKAGCNADILHGLLTTGLSYNHFVQHANSAELTSSRWGFDIRTHLKRYPNLSVSFKPFSTFRHFTDTFNIPQRPMLGSVLNGRLSYKFVRHGRIYTTSLLANTNKTVADSLQYESRLLQLLGTYAHNALTACISLGNSHQTSTSTFALPADMHFCSVSCAMQLAKGFSINFGQDIGVWQAALCRYSATTGAGYQPKKKPYCARLNMRYNTYQFSPRANWQQIYSGNVELTYRFEQKLVLKKH